MGPGTSPSLKEAVQLLSAGDKHGARRLTVQLLQKNPKLDDAWVLLGYILDEPEEQRFALNRALQINPENQKALDLLSAIESQPLADGEPPDQVLDGEGSDEKSGEAEQLRTAVAHIKARERTAAQNILKKILAQNPEQEQAWYLLSFVADTRSQKIIALRRTLSLNPQHAKAKARLKKLKPPKREKALPLSPAVDDSQNKLTTALKIARYILKRGITLFLTVVVGVYVTILVANMGGYVDELIRGMIAERMLGIGRSEAIREIPVEEREAYMQQVQLQMEESMGLNEPFLLRSARWLFNGMTLNLGSARLTYWAGAVLTGADFTTQQYVFQRLPYTLLLVGAANVLFFFSSVFIALLLSRKYGSWLDRISAALASLSAAPSWIFGIVLILVLAGGLRVLPFPKAIDLQYADFSSPRFVKLLLVQMIMPVLAIFLSVFFQGVYTWRTFFLIYSQEDYVELARAKGLPVRMMERRYILRPTLPYVVTNFALMMVGLWETALALEILFYWPGIGSLFVRAVSSYNQTPLVIAIVVVFAYILAITVFLLDMIYVFIDPRVRMGSGSQLTKAIGARRKFSPINWLRDLMAGTRDAWRGLLGWVRAIPNWFKPKRTHRLGDNRIRLVLRDIAKFPSAIVGVVIILLLIGISVYTVFAIPYDEAIELWRAHANTDGRNAWIQSPKNARPVWVNYFRKDKLPETLILDSRDPAVSKEYTQKNEGMTGITISFPFNYTYDEFPDEITLFFESQYEEKFPHVSLYWLTPDGREIRLTTFSTESRFEYRLTLDEKLSRKLGGLEPAVGLFADPASEEPTVLKGDYELRIDAIVFEENADLDCEFVRYGKVHGLAGTDHHRRDLMIALLWGTPIALVFGLLGAIGTGLISMFIAALGVWRGGWVDALIQRVTEVNLILPTLPVAIMIYFLYTRSIWAILGVIVLLNIFGSSIKNYRAAFLQIREAAFIEGAIAYGATGRRIVFRYLIPRIVPVLLPQLVIMVPGFVFYEATLAYLGLSDPYLPTWGKVVYDAFSNGAYLGYYYWILEPIILLMLTGLSFAFLGFALDRVVNPRLREV